MTLDEQIDFANKRISAADQMGFGQATFPIEPLRAIMSELVRLREDNAKLRAFEAHVRSEMDRCGVLTKTDLFVATRGDEKGGGA